VVYQSDCDGNFELYTVHTRWGIPLRLTNNSASDVSPAHIAGTDEIGFSSDRLNFWSLFAIDESGEVTRSITDREGICVDYPDWSPDASYIAASLSEECSGEAVTVTYDIYRLDASGENLLNLTETASSEWTPDWSPDGRRIAFASDRGGDVQIYVMDSDGSNVVQLTNLAGYNGRPRWSPDGSQIAFETDRDGPDWDIYIMNADGTSPRPVTANTTNDFAQSWAPDGGWLVYVSDFGGDNEIVVIGVDGQNQLRLTNNSCNDASPDWIP
jgi:tol-pal system beta propeller repeat protein TolB